MKPISLTAQLAESIKQNILDGEYPPNTQLRQDALANRYGVSRIPIREALLQLKAEGMVTLIPRKGAVVTPLSDAEIDDVFSLRLLLEPRLYRASAPLLTEADLTAAAEANRRYLEAVERQQRMDFGHLNAELHRVLYQEANMSKTQAIVASLLQTSERYTRIQLSSTEALNRSIAEHEELLQLTQQQNFEAAEALLIRHIEEVWQGLRAVLNK